MVVSSSSTHLYVSGRLHAAVFLKTVIFSALSFLVQVSIVSCRLTWNLEHFLVHPVTHFVFSLYNLTSLCEFLCFYSFNSVPVCTLSFTFFPFFQFLLPAASIWVRKQHEFFFAMSEPIFSCLRASSRCSLASWLVGLTLGCSIRNDGSSYVIDFAITHSNRRHCWCDVW